MGALLVYLLRIVTNEYTKMTLQTWQIFYKLQFIIPATSIPLFHPERCDFKNKNLKFRHWLQIFLTLSFIHNVHDDASKWNNFPRYWPSVRGTHRSPVNSPHKGPMTPSFEVCFMLGRTKYWANTRLANDLRSHAAHCDVTVMWISYFTVGLRYISI